MRYDDGMSEIGWSSLELYAVSLRDNEIDVRWEQPTALGEPEQPQ